jgi:hypothetical protein
MVEPPLCPPDGYYRWLNHEQEFSDEKVAGVKASNGGVNTSATINFAGVFFGLGCLLFALLSKGKK